MNDSRFDEVRLLVPVWGERYVAQFVDFCLASLLAEGNLPAAARRPCCFHLLTTKADADVIVRNPRWRQVQKICRTEVGFIDDLVSRASAASLTLAYARGLRAVGDRLTRTAFIFLVGDYLLARGALEAAISQIEAGASGVLSGNFQVELEGMQVGLEKLRDARSGSLDVDASQLMRLAFANLHRATYAAMVAGSDRMALPFHDPDANRVFWKVGRDALLGRFYLMHMLAILPEVGRFSVGGPSDYAFIPALCPSGNIAYLNDTDRICLVEMQPADKPVGIRFGEQDPARLAGALGVWATERHRRNAENSLLFHVGPVEPGSLAAARASSDGFVAAVNKALPARPQAADRHPYWPRMLEQFFVSAPAPASRAAIGDLVGKLASETRPSAMERLRRVFLGRLPGYRSWHPRWADWHLLQNTLADLCRDKSVRVCPMASQVLRDALVGASKASGAKETHFGDTEPADYEVCIAEWPQLPSERLGNWVLEHAANLAGNGTIILFVCDFADESEQVYLPDHLVDAQARFDREADSRAVNVTGLSSVRTSHWRRAVQAALISNARSAATGGAANAIWRIPFLCLLAAASAILNRVCLAKSASGPQECSSVIALLTLTEVRLADAPIARSHRGTGPRKQISPSKRKSASKPLELILVAEGDHAI